MSLVLAVEPDAKQADSLRRLLGQQDETELIVVSSGYAATSIMKRRVPDLVLLGASLGRKSQEVVDIFCLVSNAPNPQTLPIPRLSAAEPQGGDGAPSRKPGALADPEAFAAQVAACLARAEEQRRQSSLPEAPPPPFPAVPGDVQDGIAQAEVLQPEIEQESAPNPLPVPQAQFDDRSILINLDSLPAGDGAIDPELHEARVALLQARAEARLASELERVRREAEEQRAAELARLREEAEAQRRAEVDQARAAAAVEARDALSAELAAIRSEAEGQLATELARVRAEAAEQLAEQLEGADAARATSIEQARVAAERTASEALEAEVARVSAESEARLAAELRRVHGEAEQGRRAQEKQAEHELESAASAAAREARLAAEEAAARALEAEVARVRQESEARLAAELAHAHAEAEAARRAQQQAQIDLDAIREAATREAREAAEEAARRALEAEVERVRADADARLEHELARVRAELEHTREMQHQAQLETDAARDAAAQEARAAAEAAAARAHEVELARARADAEARLRAEMVRASEEADRARLAGETEREEVRRRMELEAGARAGATLEAEVARARADAEARLAAEVAHVQAEAERRRAAELAHMRAQLAEMHDIAREHARAAAAGTISEEVARAEITMPRAAAWVAAQVGSHTAGAVRTAGVVYRELVTYGRTAFPVMRAAWERLPARTVPAAAMVLLLTGAAMIGDVTSLTGAVTSWARSTSASASTVLSIVSRAVRPPLESVESNAATARQGDLRPDLSDEPAPFAEPSSPGFLAVFSRVPLDLYVAGRRIGTTEGGQILLPAGRYRVTLVNARLKFRGEVTLDIRPTAVTAHTVALPAGSLQVNTEPGADVWIEGEHAGVAPLGIVPVPIGTREVVVRHPALGERREYLEVRYGEVAEVDINRDEIIDPSTAYPLPRLADPGPQIR
jgi:hypothetical protein